MKDESTTALQQNFFQEKSKFELIEEKVKKTIFGVLNILLKFDDGSFFAELLSLINETCQFLYYPFYAPMAYAWKQPTLFNAVSSILSYFQTVVFFNNTQLYIVVFYVMLFLVLLVVVDIIYVSISMASKNKAAAVWPMRLLRSLVSFIVTTLFMPLVEFFIAILECSDKDESGNKLDYYQNYNIDDMHCWENIHFTVMCVLAILIVIIFVLICTVVQTIFYETRTSSENADEAKTNSLADLVALYVKIALIMLYSFLVWDKDLHWIVIPATFLVAFIQFYVYWTERPFYNEKMNTAFFIHTGIFLWGTIVLFLIKFLENSAFDGGIFIFFIGLPIIVTIILTQKDNRFKLLLTNINKFEKGDLIFKQIRYFLELVDKKHKDRISKILLKGYIFVHEEYCSLVDCPLKKYLKECEKTEKSAVNVNVNGTQTGYGMESVNNLHSSGPVLTNVGGGTTLLNTGNSTAFGNVNTEADLFLFQHAMTMFQNGISKFPSCTKLRINYAFFLMERMNNSKKSLIELKNCEKYDPSFEEEFIIFRFNQNQGGSDDDNEDDDDDGLDIVSNIAYKNHYNMFKEGLTNITAIYIEFWTLLLNHSQKSDEDLAKMNEYGEKINKLIEEIKMNYDEMEKLKYNDEEVLTLYSDFFHEILNDKTQSDYYKNRLRDIQGNGSLQNGDKGDNNELQGLPLTDEFEYIFLSAEGENMGTIVKASLGICSLFGYSLIDLIGKNIDFIMPDMYQENHKIVLINKLNKFKTQMTQNFRNNIKGGQKAAYREIFAFGKNKLKHAVPLSMKVTLMNTQDQSELFFASRIMNEDLYNDVHSKNPTPGLPPVINFNMKVCYVLTDLDFIVQFYTANAINFLGFKSNTAGNADITKSVSDLNNNEDRPELGKMSKSEVFKKRYFEQKKIIWKTLLNEEEEPDFHLESTTDKFNMKGLMNYSRKIMLNTTAITKTLSSNKNEGGRKTSQFLPLKRQKYKEDSFLLSVTEINILNQGVGYVFRFEVADTEDNDLDGYDDKNFLPTTPISHKPTTNSQADFCPGFIPDINKKFDLDTRKMAFFANTEDKESSAGVNWHSKVQEFANKKLNRYRIALEANQTHNSDEEDSKEFDSQTYDDESNSLDVTSSENYSSSNNDNETKPINETTVSKKSFLPRNPTVRDDDEFNYYHVKAIEIIKFSIYDFKKKRMVEIPKIKRESQVEYKKKDQVIDLNPRIKKRHERDVAFESEDQNSNEYNGIDTILVKQIEYALRKEEFQPEIIKLKWLSFATYAALIIISSVLFFFLTEHSSIMKENLQMVSDLHQLISNVITGTFSVRELNLLNNNAYTNLLFEREKTIKNLTDTLAKLFTDSYVLQQNILTTSIQMSDNRNNLFVNGTTTVSILEELDIVRKIDLTINSAVTQLFTSMYQISHMKVEYIISTNFHVFFYIRNSFDPIYPCLMRNMNNFLDEITVNIEKFKSNNTYILVGLILVLFASGIAVKIMYDKIIKLKSSYLEVFFEIDDNVSKKALDKCDNYAKVLHPLSGSENDSFDEDDDNAQMTPRKKQQQKQVEDNSKKSKEKKNEGYKNYFFISGIVATYSVFLSYFLAVILTFEHSLDSLLEYSEQYNMTAVQKHTYVLIYDKLKEYFFDSTFTIGNNSIKIEVENSLDYIYEFRKTESEKFKNNLLPSSYQAIYKSIYKDNLCKYTGDLFSTDNKLTQNNETCESFVSNSSNFGLDVLLSNYIENCRTQKYYFDNMLMIALTQRLRYNNTLYPFYPSKVFIDQRFIRFNPFQIFNEEEVFKLTVLRKFYLEPIFTVLVNDFYESITQFWKNNNNLYIALMVVLIISLTLFYLFFWIPFQRKLDQDIYKTKNMLSIIPKEVLALLKSINNLLNLGNSVPSSAAGVETK